MRFLQNLIRRENLLARIISLLIACGLWVYVMTDHYGQNEELFRR